LVDKERASGEWVDVPGGRFWGDDSHVGRDDIRMDVHVGIRLMMAMKTRRWPRGMVVRGCAERFLALWQRQPWEGHIWSAVEVS
jgi:hypothetical protein